MKVKGALAELCMNIRHELREDLLRPVSKNGVVEPLHVELIPTRRHNEVYEEMFPADPKPYREGKLKSCGLFTATRAESSSSTGNANGQGESMNAIFDEEDAVTLRPCEGIQSSKVSGVRFSCILPGVHCTNLCGSRCVACTRNRHQDSRVPE